MCFGHTTTSLTGLLLQLQDFEPCSAGKQTIYACVMKRRKALRQPRYEKVRLIYLLLERLIPRNPQTTPHLSSVSQQQRRPRGSSPDHAPVCILSSLFNCSLAASSLT